MNIKEAYVKARVPNCYHESGYVHLDAIPPYAQTKKVRDAELAREIAQEHAAQLRDDKRAVTAEQVMSSQPQAIPDDCPW